MDIWLLVIIDKFLLTIGKTYQQTSCW